MKVLLLMYFLYFTVTQAQHYHNWQNLHFCNACFGPRMCFGEHDNLPSNCTTCLQNSCSEEMKLKFLPTHGISCTQQAWNDPAQCRNVCPTWTYFHSVRSYYCSSCLAPCIGNVIDKGAGQCTINTNSLADPCAPESTLPCGTCYRANKCFTRRELDSLGGSCKGYLELKCPGLTNITCLGEAFSDSCSTCPRTSHTDGRFQTCQLCIDQCKAKKTCISNCKSNMITFPQRKSCPLCRAFCQINTVDGECSDKHCKCEECDSCYEKCKAMPGDDFNLFNPCKCLNKEEQAPVLREAPRARILGGSTSCDGDWPWVAYIYLHHLGPVRGGLCGGTLFNSKWLITAAHCIETNNADLFGVILGEHDVRRTSGREVYRNVSKIIIHPFFDSSSYEFDVALIQLSEAVTFNKFIQPLGLAPPGTPTDNTNPPSFAGDLCHTVGWGLTSSPVGSRSPILEQLSLRITPIALCMLQTLKGYTQGPVAGGSPKFCAGAIRGEDTCEGDSGGPLFCLHPDGQYLLHGITSHGTNVCGQLGKPGIYTKVADVNTWINLCISANRCLF